MGLSPPIAHKKETFSKIGKCGCGENHNVWHREPEAPRSLSSLHAWQLQLPAWTLWLFWELRARTVPCQQDKLIFKLIAAAFGGKALSCAAGASPRTVALSGGHCVPLAEGLRSRFKPTCVHDNVSPLAIQIKGRSRRARSPTFRAGVPAERHTGRARSPPGVVGGDAEVEQCWRQEEAAGCARRVAEGTRGSGPNDVTQDGCAGIAGRLRGARGGDGDGVGIVVGMGMGWRWGPRPLMPSSPSFGRCGERSVACYCPLVFGANVLKENKSRPERALP